MARRRSGFTLVELVVAVAITGAVAAMGYGAFATLIDRRTAIREAMAETERTAALRKLLDEWLTRGTIQALPDPDLTRRQNDPLMLVTETAAPGMGFRTALKLGIDEDPTTPARGLTLRYVAIARSEELAQAYALLANDQAVLTVLRSAMQQQRQLVVVSKELDSTVTGMRVEYLDRRTRRWFPAKERATIEPGAARITLSGSRERPLAPALQLPLLKVIPAPSSPEGP